MFQKALSSIAVVAVVALSGCTGIGGGDVEIYGEGGVHSDGSLSGTLDNSFINQAGSSTVFPVAERWAEDFGVARGVQIKVAGGGSGTGGKGLCRGELDIGDQSRPIKDSEVAICTDHGITPVSWKVAFDGLSVVVSKSNTFVDGLTVEELAHIFGAENPAQTWQDVRSSFPDKKIQACAPDAESGTWDYFNEVILEEAGDVVGTDSDGDDVHEGLRSDAQRSADDNVLVQCVKGSDAAIGFFGYAYVVENTDVIKPLKVNGVLPNAQTIADGSYDPLSRPIFMVTAGVPAKSSILYDYFHYAFHPEGGQALVPEVGYVALDEGTRLAMVQQLG